VDKPSSVPCLEMESPTSAQQQTREEQIQLTPLGPEQMAANGPWRYRRETHQVVTAPQYHLQLLLKTLHPFRIYSFPSLSLTNGPPCFPEGLLPFQRTDVILVEGFTLQPTVGIPQPRKRLLD